MRQDRLAHHKGAKFEILANEGYAPKKELSPVPIDNKPRARWGDAKKVEETKSAEHSDLSSDDDDRNDDREDDFDSADSDDDLTKASV